MSLGNNPTVFLTTAPNTRSTLHYLVLPGSTGGILYLGLRYFTPIPSGFRVYSVDLLAWISGSGGFNLAFPFPVDAPWGTSVACSAPLLWPGPSLESLAVAAAGALLRSRGWFESSEGGMDDEWVWVVGLVRAALDDPCCALDEPSDWSGNRRSARDINKPQLSTREHTNHHT